MKTRFVMLIALAAATLLLAACGGTATPTPAFRIVEVVSTPTPSSEPTPTPGKVVIQDVKYDGELPLPNDESQEFRITGENVGFDSRPYVYLQLDRSSKDRLLLRDFGIVSVNELTATAPADIPPNGYKIVVSNSLGEAVSEEKISFIQPKGWRCLYYNDWQLRPELEPTLVVYYDKLTFNWGLGAPAKGVNTDFFILICRQRVNFTAGNYVFWAHLVDDGIEILVDGQSVVKYWDQAPGGADDPVRSHVSKPVPVSEGSNVVEVRFLELSGLARFSFGWEKR